jgi:GNAT superfamily N-acetyltransferase
MELRAVRFTDPEVEPLLSSLSADYEARYGADDEMAAATAADFTPPNGTFLVIVRDGETVAGDGIRRMSGEACEVKRMWTAPAHRRRGYASAVLEALEGAARELGYTYIRAETGPAQPEALAFYRRRGYREIPSFGPYEVAFAFEATLTEET